MKPRQSAWLSAGVASPRSARRRAGAQRLPEQPGVLLHADPGRRARGAGQPHLPRRRAGGGRQRPARRRHGEPSSSPTPPRRSGEYMKASCPTCSRRAKAWSRRAAEGPDGVFHATRCWPRRRELHAAGGRRPLDQAQVKTMVRNGPGRCKGPRQMIPESAGQASACAALWASRWCWALPLAGAQTRRRVMALAAAPRGAVRAGCSCHGAGPPPSSERLLGASAWSSNSNNARCRPGVPHRRRVGRPRGLDAAAGVMMSRGPGSGGSPQPAATTWWRACWALAWWRRLPAVHPVTSNPFPSLPGAPTTAAT